MISFFFIKNPLAWLDQGNSKILVLGGQSVMCRLLDYKPFNGCGFDGFLYILPDLLGPSYFDTILNRLEQIDYAIKLPDYPNLSVVKKDTSNLVYKTIEIYLDKNFDMVKAVPPKNSYPYDYKNGAYIFKRKTNIQL